MKLRITVHGNAYEVEVEVLDPGEGFPSGPLPRVSASSAPAPSGPSVAPPPLKTPTVPVNGPTDGVTSPIAGTVLEIKCKPGDTVACNQELLVIEAMKMETSIAAPSAGKIKSVDVAVGDAVREGQTLVKFD